MSNAVVLLADDDPGALGAVEQEFLKRYGADYRIVAHTSTGATLNDLRELRDVDRAVPVVLADLWMPSMASTAFLAQTHDPSDQDTEVRQILLPTQERRRTHEYHLNSDRHKAVSQGDKHMNANRQTTAVKGRRVK